MSRPLKQAFRSEALRELVDQLRYSPADKRLSQVLHLEQLHDDIEPDRTYPLDFIIYRITGYRRGRQDESLLLVGEAVQPDLRLMIDILSKTIDLPLTGGDSPTETADQLAARLSVSTKTVSRWRQRGLRWRWVTPPLGGRKVVGFTRKAAEAFLESHHDQVQRASRFTQLSSEDRERIIERARRLASAGRSLNQVASQIARQQDRALETIRQILEKHDQQHPDDPLFPARRQPLSPRDKRVIARAYRWGIPISDIAARFDRSATTIHRAITDLRISTAQQFPLTFVSSPLFARDDADRVFLREQTAPPASARPKASAAQLTDLPEDLRAWFAGPALPHEQQRSLFLRYNFCKYEARQLRDAFDRRTTTSAELDTFDNLVALARDARRTLVRASLPIVLSVVRRHCPPGPPRHGEQVLGLLQTGLDVLTDAIEGHNASRSDNFDAVLTNRLLRAFAQQADSEEPRRARRRSAEEQLTRELDAAIRKLV